MMRRTGILCFILSIAAFVNAQVYVMDNLGNISTCSGTFYDSGNANGDYGDNEDFEVTFCSSSGQPVYLDFSAFRMEENYDSIYIYDGNSTAAPLIGGYTGTISPGAVISSNASNCLTVTFTSDGSVNYIGWVAAVGCGTPPPPPPPSPGTVCNISQAFCSGTAYNFPAATNTTAEVGPDYDCLSTQPNPVWYYLQIATPGNMDITLSNTANVDVDFVCWGPFPSSNSCASLTGGNVVDCSYSPIATEFINIPNAVVGEYYILCITNFSNSPTNFTLTTQGSSTATTNCNILCNIAAMTANPGVCNPLDNTHDVSGTLTVQYPPNAGTLTITAGGQSIVLNPPFANSVNYSIPGINSTGGTIAVDAQFSTDTSCHFTSTYTSPAPCTCTVTATNNTPVCTGTTVQLTATATGNPTQYQWSGPNGYTDNTQNPVIGFPTVTHSGIYSVTITAGSCTATDTTEVVVIDGPTFSQTITDATCNGATDGSIVLTVNGAPPFTYTWAGTSSTSDIAANLAAGNYSVTVSNGGSCSATGAFTVGEPTPIVLGSPTITDASCSGGGSASVPAVGGTGTLNYLWSTGEPTNTISNVAAGPYELTVTDQNGCSASVTINVGAAPNAIIFGTPAVTDVSCTGGNNGSITASASGGSGTITFTWGSNTNNATGTTISNLIADTYTVVATDPTGCSALVSYLITEPTPIVFGTPAITDATCSVNGSITVSATGGTGAITFNWSNGFAGSVVNVPAGTYTVTATDQNTCTATAAYTVNPDPNSVILGTPAIVDVSCIGAADGSVTVNATGGSGTLIYEWSTSPAQTTPTASGLSAGPVNLTVSDANNCSTSATYIVSEPAAPVTITTEAINATCNMAANGSITATAIGGSNPYTYQWDDADNQIGKTAMGLVARTYTVIVTDAHGCTATASDVVSEPADMTINTDAEPVKCVAESNGSITVVVVGGTRPYNYSATPDGANFIYPLDTVIEGLPIGTYTVIVSDSFGCTKTAQAVVPNAALDNFVTATDSTSCYGRDYNDGQVHIETTSPANGPYTYSIDNGIPQFSGEFYNLSAGPHVIVATSYNNCVTTVPVLVLEPLPIVVDVVPDTVVLPLGQGQQVQVTYLNAPGEVTYTWTPELGLSCTDCPNPLVSPFIKQDYVITIGMVNGSATCYGSATLHADVSQPLPLYIPNGFSPNGDGNNDVFQIYGSGIKTINLQVFNRWGEMVYDSNNQFSGWDGTYKGEMQQPAVFTYSAQVTFLDDTKYSQKGSVTIIR